MNPWSMAGWGFGPGCMLGTKHLFGEQSGSSAVWDSCFHNAQFFPHHEPAAPIGWWDGKLLLPPPPGDTAAMETAGAGWSLEGGSGSEDRRGGDARTLFFYLPRPLPSSCKWTSKPSVAGEPSTGRDGKSIRNNLRNGALRSNFLAHVPKILRTQLLQG